MVRRLGDLLDLQSIHGRGNVVEAVVLPGSAVQALVGAGQ